MPEEFKKAVDYTLIGLKNTYCFLDDILTVCKRSEEEHEQYVLKCFKRLDEKTLGLIFPNVFFQLEIHWLRHHISQSPISPLESKTSAILTLEAPKTIMKLRSFLGLVHNFSKFIPNLAQVIHPLRPLLKISSKFVWTDLHENCSC